MSSIFLSIIFCKSVFFLLQWKARAEEIGGRQIKSKSSRQLLWDATWKMIVTDCAHGVANAVSGGISSKSRSIKRRAGGYRNIENFKKPTCFALVASIFIHGNAG
jgi:hypothetical protein